METVTLALIKRVRKLAVECEGLGDEHLDALFQQVSDNFYLRFIYLLVGALKPSVSVELGTGTGRATAHMAAGYLGGRVVTIDPEEHGAIARNTAPYANVEFIRTRSDDPSLLSRVEDRSVGFCFIDSVHSGAYTLKEVGLWTPKMEDGGLFLFDDLELNDSMRTVLPNLPFEEKGLLDGLHIHAGFGYAIAKHV